MDVPTGQTYYGHAGWLQLLQSTVNTFPDSTLTLTNVVANDHYIATQCIFRGTHTGSLTMPQGELAPTGRLVKGSAAGFFLTASGKIAEYRRYSDVLAFLGLAWVNAKAGTGDRPRAILTGQDDSALD